MVVFDGMLVIALHSCKDGFVPCKLVIAHVHATCLLFVARAVTFTLILILTHLLAPMFDLSNSQSLT